MKFFAASRWFRCLPWALVLAALLVMQSAASARVEVASGTVNAQSGEMIQMHVTAYNPSFYEVAAEVEIYDAQGNVIIYDGRGVSGNVEFDVHVPCGVDQPSMNATTYKIFNGNPGLGSLTASATITRSRDGEIAADTSGLNINDSQETSGGKTLFGALAKVDENNPEDGKYYVVHLEKGELLTTSGWAISDDPMRGATLFVEIQDPNTGGWGFINGVAPSGYAEFTEAQGTFVAPTSGSYGIRARCTANRICKFAVHLTVKGRNLAPCYDCDISTPTDKGSNNLPVNLSDGREQSEFGADLMVPNPIGPDVAFGRKWREVLALQKVGSPGLARGWMHSYDVRLSSSGTYDLQVQFAEGGQEIWTAVLDANGNPTGQLNPPSGAPYTVQGTLTTNPDTPANPVTRKWASVVITWDDGSQWSFVPAELRYNYRLDRQTNSTGQWLQFAYNAAGALSSIANQSNTTLLSLNYNAQGYLESVVDLYNRRIAYAWGQPAGLPETVLTAVSLIHSSSSTSPATFQQYGYAAFTQEEDKPLLQTITSLDPNGSTRVVTASNSYDALGRVALTTDANGNQHRYSYLNGETFIEVRNLAGMTVMVWSRYFDARGRDTGTADASLHRWTTYYDDPNNPLKPTRSVDPLGRTTTTTYDVYGHVTKVTSPRGVSQVSTYSYATWPLGRLVKTQIVTPTQTYAATTYSYFEPSGLVNTVFSPHPEAGGATQQTRFTYDAYGNPTSITAPGESVASRTTTFNYLQDGSYSHAMFVGHPLSISDALGHTTHLRYDGRGNLKSSTDAAGIVTSNDYFLSDQLNVTYLPASGQTGSGQGKIIYTYNYLGGPLRHRQIRNESNVVIQTDQYSYGKEGELTREYGNHISQSVEYDALYRRTAFKDGNGNATSYFYDNNGRLTATAYPNANSTTGFNMERTTSFDDSGLPLQTVDGRGVVSNLAYTPDGLPETVSYPASPAENVTLSYNGFGQPTGRTDASGSETYSYNAVGLMTTQSTRYRNSNGTLMSPFTQTRHFYGSGAMSQLATSLGNLNYAYDAAGRLNGLQDPDGATTGWNYGLNDWLQGQTLPTGTTTEITHNLLGQITAQRNANASNLTLSSWGHPTDASQSQRYNAQGQLVRSVAFSTPDFKWGGQTDYTYDSLNQLSGESSGRGAAWNGQYSHSFAYSGAGNPTTWKGQTRTFNSNNQETTTSAFLYDGAGNTLQLPNGNLATPTTVAPTQKLVYNAQGQLSELRDAANVLVAKYAYRGDGKRAWKELANGTRSYFYYAGEQMIAISNGTNASTLLLWGADGLIGMRSSVSGVVTKRYQLYDTQGNLAQVLDETGAVVNQAAFSAWGEPLRDGSGSQAIAGAFGYGAKFGYWRDDESGFVLCTLRYYDPSAGRWLTRDPIGYAGGSNLYGYVSGDPVNNVDPSGLAQVQVKYWTIPGLSDVGVGLGHTDIYHAYIIVSNNDGSNPYVFHGWHGGYPNLQYSGKKGIINNRGFLGGPLGVMGGFTGQFGWFGFLSIQYGSFGSRWPEFSGSDKAPCQTIIRDNKPAQYYIRKFQLVADAYNKDQVLYDPLGPNSNTAIWQILERGLTIKVPDPVHPVPGWNNPGMWD